MVVPFLITNIDETTTTNRFVNGIPVGKYTYGYANHCFNGSLLREIGAFCSINSSVKIGEVNHPTNLITTHPILYTPEEEILGYEGIPGIYGKEKVLNIFDHENNEGIYIKNDVWIGANAIILPGVTIHNGAVIGAGAVVTKDIPAYAIVVGVPAKIIKYRFNPEEIEVLERVQWWNWEVEEIEQSNEYFNNPKLFFEKFKR
ncbi:antibiotic acetyltransferase [Sporosarcina sp. PTS2304]|nr:antibiotic acetyltransferase [Sporosarcina sp. PTS2304]